MLCFLLCFIEKNVSRDNFKIYSKDNLQLTIRGVSAGETCYKMSKKYDVPYQTLHDRLNKNPTSKATVLNEMEENHLAKWITDCSAVGIPKTKIDIKKAAAEICSIFKRKINGKHFKNKLPSEKWFISFLKRHSEVRFRVPESLGRASANVSEANLRNWFKNVENFLEQKGLSDLLKQPSRIFNIDESGFQLNPKPKKVLAKKGQRNVYIVEASNPKENITATYNICADGTMVPPMITFQKNESKLYDIARTMEGNITCFINIF